MSDYSPYCPICTGCGEDGCCAATCCQQHPDGAYCETYLRDLKFGYHLYKSISNALYEKLPADLKEEYDLIWDQVYDQVYKSEEDAD